MAEKLTGVSQITSQSRLGMHQNLDQARDQARDQTREAERE